MMTQSVVTSDKGNLFELPENLSRSEEFIETILSNESSTIERIISTGQSTSEGVWYDQERDEWVVLLQGNAVLEYADGSTVNLKNGDYLFLPAHKKHRVQFTSSEPACIWLAVHVKVDRVE